MSKGTPLREDEHLKRSARHQTIGEALAGAGDEWAAVPLFYSAYHLVKAALLVDPIWSDLRQLTALDADLSPDARFINRHHGRRRPSTGQPREWGLNELVLKLYRPVAGSYERLHQASITVRYGVGLPAGAVEPLTRALEQIQAVHEAGDLTAPLRWTPSE